MLEKFLNKNVSIRIADYANPGTGLQKIGVVTGLDKEFIELDNDFIIAIKYIATIKLA